MKSSIAFYLIVLSSLSFGVKVPTLSDAVMDEARLLRAGEIDTIRSSILKMNAYLKIQMAVFITSSLQENDIETFSMAVAEEWKLGRKGEDRGLLLVIAPSERAMRFEVGYGLEGVLTDAFCKKILDDYVSPLFKQGHYRDGILLAIEIVQSKLSGSGEIPEKNRLISNRGPMPMIILGALLLLFLIMMPFVGLLNSGLGSGGRYYRRGNDSGRNRDDWFGGGGFGGSSGGFGGFGGGFGGGGASSRW